MGSLSDNLLKLTEFPFSYSFIGLIALIFGHGMNLEGPSLANLGPLIILIGFIATTLSIIDPVGAFQKLGLIGLSNRFPTVTFVSSEDEIAIRAKFREINGKDFFGREGLGSPQFGLPLATYSGPITLAVLICLASRFRVLFKIGIVTLTKIVEREVDLEEIAPDKFALVNTLKLSIRFLH